MKIEAVYRQKNNVLYSIGRASLFLLCTLLAQLPLHAQEPVKLEVFVTREMAFGSFFAGREGGTLTLFHDGSLSTTGTIVAGANSSGSPALLEIEAPPGQLIHIEFPESVVLKRVGSEETLTLTDFKSDKPENSFMTTAANPPYRNPVWIGATLLIPASAANLSGNYECSFSFTVTCIQE
ncbi:MAG TPA: DUF4402 domain-containing protein [Paludibacteraceae bacterium]|nr:DUF4402 domain-containing protein [Paludibacteraceae bacterium]